MCVVSHLEGTWMALRSSKTITFAPCPYSTSGTSTPPQNPFKHSLLRLDAS